LIDGICAYCGKGFQFYQSWPRVHCSSFCYGQSKSGTTPGRFYYGPNWQIQRAFAITRDNGKCVDCNADLMNGQTPHVHHIKSLRSFDGDWKAANALGNLVTVCPPCHLKRHGGRYGDYDPTNPVGIT
jgi:5-methylcytosine-specific restriction endonuclease McrA